MHVPLNLDVLNPVGHMALAFSSGAAAELTVQRLLAQGLEAAQFAPLSPAQMVDQIDLALRHSSPLAGFGQEVNLARGHREMALAGCSFLLAHAEDDHAVERVTSAARENGAQSAHLYGRLVITELIEHTAATAAADILVRHDLNLPKPAPGAAQDRSEASLAPHPPPFEGPGQ